MLDHESVHSVQDMLSGGRAYSTKRSPIINPKEYLSHYSEVMAYARTLVKDLRDSGLEDSEIIKKISTGNIDHWIWNNYRGLDGKVWNSFKKAVYQYLDM
jgi:hypothetical protein